MPLTAARPGIKQRLKLGKFQKLLPPLFAVSGVSAAALGSPARDFGVLVDDVGVLEQAESQGLSFGRVVGRGTFSDNKALYQGSAVYRQIVDSLAADLHLAGLKDKRASVSMAGAHRLFDQRWLKSPAAHFELTGIVNRLDRQPFHPTKCGETRLVYRLRYAVPSQGERLTSRLPMTVNVVFWQDPGERVGGAEGAGGGNGSACNEATKRWLGARGKEGEALLAYLISDAGPLAPQRLESKSLKAIETNFQSVRWPSTTRPDLGAHAEYMLRVFVSDSGGKTWAPGPLENTPDTVRLKGSAKLREGLLAWIKDPKNLELIDLGVAKVPEEFLAKKVSSVSPRGLSRLANRPYSQLFAPTDVQDINLNKFINIGSPAALLRRLDDLSCAGCHQARTVAGFHLLGADRKDTTDVNFVNVTGSPHLHGDLLRRSKALDARAGGQTPDSSRSFSEHTESGAGGYGAHCGLGDPGFAAWTCTEGLSCQAVGIAAGDRTVGQCFPSANGAVGDPCETGTMVLDADPTKDKVVNAKTGTCRDSGVCYGNYGGFPEGMCGVSCAAEVKDATCGGVAVLKDFNGCLARGVNFAKCSRENVNPLGLRACGDDLPCRDDYLCVRTSEGQGACIPPYFLFQMRVDGHQKPPQ